MSNLIFDLHRKPIIDETINLIESRTYLPYIKSFRNNDIIEITINRTDVWLLMHDAVLIIRGKLTKKSAGGTVKLVNNAGAFMFDSVMYELNGIELEQVKDPGIVSLIRGYLCYTEEDTKHLSPASWTWPKDVELNTDNSFNMRIPLSHLFGIFNDYKRAMCGKHTLRLVRSRHDNDCMITTGEGTEATLTIDDIALKVKHVVPNDVLKLELLQAIKSDRPILIPFRKWELHELPVLNADSTKEIWSVKTTTAVEVPRYVIVAFQNEKKNIPDADATLFDHLDISDVRLFLNGQYFPYEQMKLDLKKNDYAEVHSNYVDFYRNFMNVERKQPLLNFTKFKDRMLFVIDCSHRDENMKSSVDKQSRF